MGENNGKPLIKYYTIIPNSAWSVVPGFTMEKYSMCIGVNCADFKSFTQSLRAGLNSISYRNGDRICLWSAEIDKRNVKIILDVTDNFKLNLFEFDALVKKELFPVLKSCKSGGYELNFDESKYNYETNGTCYSEKHICNGVVY